MTAIVPICLCVLDKLMILLDDIVSRIMKWYGYVEAKIYKSITHN